jgi:hypothetical protein
VIPVVDAGAPLEVPFDWRQHGEDKQRHDGRCCRHGKLAGTGGHADGRVTQMVAAVVSP